METLELAAVVNKGLEEGLVAQPLEDEKKVLHLGPGGGRLTVVTQ
jgi:hypothetical protein